MNYKQSFNEKPLNDGDEVVIVFGKHLRNSVIEKAGDIYTKIVGLKAIIDNNKIYKP